MQRAKWQDFTEWSNNLYNVFLEPFAKLVRSDPILIAKQSVKMTEVCYATIGGDVGQIIR